MRPVSYTWVPDSVSNDSKRRPPTPGSKHSTPGRRPASLYFRPRLHHRSVSCVKTAKASAGSTPTKTDTVAWSPDGRCGFSLIVVHRGSPGSLARRCLGVRFECVELHRPESLDLVQPVAKRFEWLRLEPIQTDTRVVIDAAILNQSASSQCPQMTAQSRR